MHYGDSILNAGDILTFVHVDVFLLSQQFVALTVSI